ncbi:putative amidohydrolase YtcJ [Microbacterium sp. W4I4]|uniref:amidohydrolase n=1 Tax=Microbacterium sp. W4I4 TaxID=3042295 RepID=UPI002788F237|nr:amidohydrolase [Microbacterium sp. W4I4]MDQ0613083.1 putative amidohydrolase YtcJ [Microbacterium sp. W4I4]
MAATLYRNGRIHLMDGSGRMADSLLVEDGTITAVGAFAELRDRIGRPVAEADLERRAVLPGLADAHIHTSMHARTMATLDLRGVRSLGECLELIRVHAAKSQPGEWVFGNRWDSNIWDVPVQPNRHDLDAICPDKPVALPSIDGHSFWLNSRALEALGYDRRTPDPAGGEIVRDAHGDPTGILREVAGHPVEALMASPLSGDLAVQLRATQEHLLSVGLTSIHDLDGEDCRGAYREMREAGDLKIRVHKSIPMAFLDEAIAEGRITGDGDDWISTGPVKLFSDGALGSHTAHMGEDFPGMPGNHGIEVIEYAELVALIRKAASAGIAVATHAIGDEANHLVLDAYAETKSVSDARRLRHRVEHAQHMRREDVARFAELGVIASMQPTHCTSDIALSNALLSGRELANYPWRSLLDAGAALAFGSDAPVEDPDPLHGIHAAVTRQDRFGEPEDGWEPQERLSIVEAWDGFSKGPAFAAGMEAKLGRLTAGRLADFIVLSEDPFEVAPHELRDLSVMTTVVGGEIRFQR